VHFLVDASMPRSTAPLVRSRGHQATDVRDIGLGVAPDEDIAASAQAQQLAILSRDFDFADVRNYPPDQYAGIVVMDLPNTATLPTILNLVDVFLQQTQTFNDLPGRLAIVAPGRIRLRPAP
jgi:predicted nuclease of predicted toxin-antitoxin system